MVDLEENKSKLGVTCHLCRVWIRPGLIYYRHHYAEFNLPKYTNYCIKCAQKKYEEAITESNKALKQINKLLLIYKKDNRIICDKCKNKYKHLVGDCNPVEKGCRPKLIKAFIH